MTVPNLSQDDSQCVGYQHPDGRWTGDKWHTSWIYTTTQIVIALHHTPAAHRGIKALLRAQTPDGGWGTRQQATAGETGYAVLALAAHTGPRPRQNLTTALRRAADWLTNWQQSDPRCDCHLWTGKELYCPTRVDRVVAHAGLLAATRPT
ncbi:hypothetical protein GCM10023205_74040 [Yinghuangia aomiensis]|uniref:Squalene cyclase C-terminal domain-containing protein n=1 Tax=Yinghuangia aomiensis TaxID=676205 RepID=A0ABP9I8Y3_9ACTN